MCGIAGSIAIENDIHKQVAHVQRATDAQQHRGPDDQDVVVVHPQKPSVVFGHRRLAIIDISQAGHQPMYDPDTGNWLTFNGEIYNFCELRCELEAHGQVFRTQTDTEVILKAYATWGIAAVYQLRGIFAFGLWDRQKQQLLLARDQLGVKPLYYWQDGGTLLFASEVRALLASGLVARKLDRDGLHSYLSYGSVQEPLTLVAGVHSLPPGHLLIWEERKFETMRYWQLPSPATVARQAPQDMSVQTVERLTEAVKLQLVADVPLGAFLSGGIDSTAIVALMQKVSNRAIKTFSVIFEEKAYDERTYAQIAARHIGTDHTELLLSGTDVRRHLKAALAAYDQPSQDGINTYFVSKVTREAGLTVALSGVGGDELFGGYNGYQKALAFEQWGKPAQQLPGPIKVVAANLLSFLTGQEGARKAANLLQSTRNPYFVTRQVFGPRQVAALLPVALLSNSDSWQSASFNQLERETAGYDAVNRVSALELQTYMLSTLLRDTDQMSMAHALEVRVPLIDHKLVEYLFTLPGACKVDKQQPKPLLTRALNGMLPMECVYRPKRGFEFPFAIWLRASFNEEMRSLFLGESSQGTLPFSQSGLAQLWLDFERGYISWSRIWGIFVLCHWLTEQRVVL